MLEQIFFPAQVAAGVTEKGDIAITGIDPQTGMTITIVVESSAWKEVYAKLGRLRGVGIYRANRVNSDLAG